MFKDYASFDDRCEIINNTIEEFVTGLPHDVPMIFVGETRKAIDKCFGQDNIDDILASLKQYENDNDLGKWAKKTSETIRERSPTSVKVTLKQMQLGKTWSIADAFEHEYNIAGVFMSHHDFVEGVTARLIRKETPKWNPATLDEVSWNDVDKFFAPPEGRERLRLLATGKGTAYEQYPHAWIGLPNEAAIRDVVTDKSKASSFNKVVEHFVSAKNGKLGVKEKVRRGLEAEDNETRRCLGLGRLDVLLRCVVCTTSSVQLKRKRPRPSTGHLQPKHSPLSHLEMRGSGLDVRWGI